MICCALLNNFNLPQIQACKLPMGRPVTVLPHQRMTSSGVYRSRWTSSVLPDSTCHQAVEKQGGMKISIAELEERGIFTEGQCSKRGRGCQ